MSIRGTVAFWLITIFVLTACGTTEQPTQVALAGPKVPTRRPTETFTPTLTPTDTPSPIPTDTPTFTLTPSNTPTFTLTPSDTPTDTPTFTFTPTLTLLPSDTPTLMPTNTELPSATPVAAASVFGGSIGLDEQVSGEIGGNTYEILYTFEGSAGNVISIEMIAQSGDLDTLLKLLDPDQNEIEENDDRDEDTNSVIGFATLPTTGTYTIVATRFGESDGSTEGQFNLDLILEDTGSTVTDGRIDYGETETGLINNAAPFVDYGFAGLSGDVITVRLVATSGDLDPLVEILNAGGTSLASNDDESDTSLNSAIHEFVIPEDGDYTVRATRYEGVDGSTTGTFAISLELISGQDRPVTDSFTPIPIDLDETISGSIYSGHYLQLYSFEGRVSQEITVEMTQESNDLLPALILLDPDERPIARYDSVNGDGITATLDNIDLPVTGIYTIVATRTESNIGITSGDYDITVYESSGDTEVATQFLDISYMEDGESIQDSLSSQRFEVLYRFLAQEGDVVTSTLRSVNGDIDTLLILQDAYGQEVARNDDNVFDDDDISNSEVYLALLDEDRYYFLTATAFDTESLDKGEYELTLFLEDQYDPTPYRAVLDPFESHGIKEDGDTLLYLAVGDWTDADNNDLATSSVITFQLPELEPDDEVSEVLLDLSDCAYVEDDLFVESGDDLFNEFGELTVYLNGTYTSNLDVTDDATYLDEVGRLTECGVLDVTDYVLDTYEAGMPIIQFHLEFDSFHTIENGEVDAVIFASAVLDVYADE